MNNDDIDHEFDWIVRTCLNGLNIFITMLHVGISENMNYEIFTFPGKYFFKLRLNIFLHNFYFVIMYFNLVIPNYFFYLVLFLLIL